MTDDPEIDRDAGGTDGDDAGPAARESANKPTRPFRRMMRRLAWLLSLGVVIALGAVTLEHWRPVVDGWIEAMTPAAEDDGAPAEAPASAPEALALRALESTMVFEEIVAFRRIAARAHASVRAPLSLGDAELGALVRLLHRLVELSESAGLHAKLKILLNFGQVVGAMPRVFRVRTALRPSAHPLGAECGAQLASG